MATPVSPAVSTTFRILAASEAAQISAVLIAALDVPREAIQYAAAQSILERTSEHDHFQLLRRLPQLPTSVAGLAVSQSAILQPAFRQALLHGSPETRGLACAAIRSTGLTAPLVFVLDLVRNPQSPDAELTAETLRDVVSQLYDRWQQAATRAAARLPRDQVLKELSNAIDRCERGEVPEDIAASVLVLGDPAHPVVRRTLWHGAPATREALYRLIRESQHPGVLRFIAASLHDRYPHPQVFLAVQERTDPEFVAALLTVTTRQIPPQVEQNLQQIERFDWLSPPLERLETVPPALQPAAAAFVQAARLPREQKAAALEWLLRHGTTAAKLAATEGLSLLDQGMAQEVVRENLQADDAAVQAWATSQLRHTAMPDAYALLVERLESPLPEVQAAARHELGGFNTERVLSLADDWSADEARRAGKLLLKVSPDAVAQLRRELLHPARQKRIRTARRVFHLGLHGELAETMVALADDADPLVRRTAAEVLEHVSSPAAENALLNLLDDAHPRVREAAAAALRHSRRQPVAMTL